MNPDKELGEQETLREETEAEVYGAASVTDTAKKYRYCSAPPAPEPSLPSDRNPDRVRAIVELAHKWANGTMLRYYFFDKDNDGESVLYRNGDRVWQTWVGNDNEKDVVRAAFKEWKGLGIGLDFEEVATRDEAEIRIGFMRGDGAWSYLGTQILDYGPNKRTMNFGWSLLGTDGLDTALHEIGHTLGLPHEHQNPNAGIVWDEEAVYADLAAPPNQWSRENTYHNIIRKIPADSVQGSYWDPDSVMHYPFKAGLIIRPEKFASGLKPNGGLSRRDIAWVKFFYPPIDNDGMVDLMPSQSQELAIKNGEQQNYLISPPATRYYDIRTFGTCDTAMSLFEMRDNSWRYVTTDDDSGEDRNASLRVKLVKERRYALRVRLKYSDTVAMPTIMMW
ncbi:hypothetical protein FW320_06330 [Azospirillum sp. Vi22]|uniref:M12 family metallopeptidase n=1 Tax=Azospirillum baldaniorum TaxID=1064539 RepID=UPI00157AA9C8|nr:M12 family metallopeptidase [Azospirillum baldaniorum]NUB05792.1 hypothetical protein [Azospirillum baldaniorum]